MPHAWWQIYAQRISRFPCLRLSCIIERSEQELGRLDGEGVRAYRTLDAVSAALPERVGDRASDDSACTCPTIAFRLNQSAG